MRLVCGKCREEQPFLLSCVHTFAPPKPVAPLGAYDRDAAKDEADELADWARHAASGM